MNAKMLLAAAFAAAVEIKNAMRLKGLGYNPLTGGHGKTRRSRCWRGHNMGPGRRDILEARRKAPPGSPMPLRSAERACKAALKRLMPI